jgi:hypothetical protein
MITTIPDYCKQRNVTRQFVYEYIKKGKFKHYEMPVFVESNGDKIMLGNQKVLEVPEEFAPKKSDTQPFELPTIEGPEYLINSITDDPVLSNLYRNLLSKESKADKMAAQNDLNMAIELHPDRDRLKIALDEANIRLMQYMVKMQAFMQDVVKEAHEAYEAKNTIKSV